MWFGFVWKRTCFAALGGFSPSVQLLWGRCERQLWGVTSVLCSEAAASVGSALSLTENVKGPRLLPKNRGHFAPKSPNTGLFIHHSVIMWYFFSPKTPSSWTEETRGRRSAGGHKRSASWGSAEHLREVAKLRNQLQKRSRHVPPPAGHEPPHHPLSAGHAAGITQTPLNRLAPRLRRSVEGLNLELEEAFVSEKPEDQHEILDIPDGHRAPVPVQRCSSGSQSEPSPGPLDLDPSLFSPSQSPSPLDPSLLSPSSSPSPLNPSNLSPSQSPCPMGEPEPADCETACPAPSTPLPSFALDPPLLQPCSSAPRPSKTYSFQREPPEGCERVRVCEEGTSACQDEPLLQPSCPDPNKVNFTPHGGSAFCPVSLLKPLLPSMDLLFRGLSVSPVTGCPGQASPTRHLGTQ
uniref:Family with sequence similarity 117 member Aa n=1 Tax=Gasterosteus aculeatus aculeatus TaxID=481459 RepID=A0AAQ4QRY2_GASAC|nr:protein FAM117A isoform X1 [Gasterosteus aculeatus aculeatus]